MLQGSDNLINFFNSLKTYRDIRKLIKDGEAEGQYLECKSPLSLSGLDRNLQAEISRVLSGFSNAGGGIFVFGVSTDRKHELDVLTQIDPIGLIENFLRKLELRLPLLTEPVIKLETKIIKNRPSDKKGIVLMYVPGNSGDPIRARDHKFYLRTGDQTLEMPYEVIKRMFLGATTPDLDIVFSPELIKQHDDKKWEIPVIIKNEVSVPAKSITVSIEINNLASLEEISASDFRDLSRINPRKKIFMLNLQETVHKELNIVIGNLFIKMKPRKRLVELTIRVYAEYMRAKDLNFKIDLLSKEKIKVTKMSEKFLY